MFTSPLNNNELLQINAYKNGICVTHLLITPHNSFNLACLCGRRQREESKTAAKLRKEETKLKLLANEVVLCRNTAKDASEN